MEKVPDIMNVGCRRLEFTVYGKPVPQERPRFVGHAFDPKKSREYKALAKEAIEEAMFNQAWRIVPKEMPIKMYMTIYKKIPSTEPVWFRTAAEAGLIAPTKKTGDIENIAKGIMDSGTGLIYEDDCQVYSLHCEQRYSDTPRVDVIVEYTLVDFGKVKDAVKLMRGARR